MRAPGCPTSSTSSSGADLRDFPHPSAFAGGDENKRWDTSRNAVLSEIPGFYGLAYWYAEQVTILGLGPIWQSNNKEAMQRGGPTRSGRRHGVRPSEREHGADIYNTDMILTPASEDDGEGVLFRASGENTTSGTGTSPAWCRCSPALRRRGRRGIRLVRRRLAARELRTDRQRRSRPDVREHLPARQLSGARDDILETGPEAFSAALNTVNVGKFNLLQRVDRNVRARFLRAITHANNRILYGNPVTDFPHVRASFVDAYGRLIAMKLFSDRAIDYFRSASREDRRYLLFNPVTKSKVTSEGEVVVELLRDILAAKGIREEHLLRRGGSPDRRAASSRGHGACQRRANPEVHAELHVQSGRIPRSGITRRPGRRRLLLVAGAARGASKIQFSDWAPIYESRLGVPNVARFYDQAQSLKELLLTAPPDADQMRDLDFMLVVGHLFTLVVYGQLILEQAALAGIDDDLVDQIFDFQVRDFSAHAVALHGRRGSTDAQQAGPCRRCASRSPTGRASTGCGSGSRPMTAPTR